MSWNNIIPWWCIELEEKETHLSLEQLIQWLYSDEAKELLPDSVRTHQIQLREMELWGL